jgi:hypothetical protein
MTKTQMVKYAALGILILCALIMVWKWSDWRASAQAGSAYAARLTCSCRFVEHRSAKSCARDVDEDAGAVTITEDTQAKRITGSVPLLGKASAQYKEGFGCLMLPQ